MADFQSKVTRRPRSKLERVVEVLHRDAEAPSEATGLTRVLEELDCHVAETVRRALPALQALPLNDARAQLQESGVSHRPTLDRILLWTGHLSSVAPSEGTLRLVVRLGYPGESFESVARALDAELPASEGLSLARRANGLLDRHSRAICLPVEPRCNKCCIAAACGFRGIGADPSARLQSSS